MTLLYPKQKFPKGVMRIGEGRETSCLPNCRPKTRENRLSGSSLALQDVFPFQSVPWLGLTKHFYFLNLCQAEELYKYFLSNVQSDLWLLLALLS